MNRFFVACPLGFESELRQELYEVGPYLLDSNLRENHQPVEVTEAYKGGLEIEAPWHLGLQLNRFSKLAHRILYRVSQFHCQDFSKLLRKIKEAKTVVDSVSEVSDFEISCSQSRINDERKVRQLLQSVFEPLSSSSGSKIFFRIHDDQVSISLDTTGEHLHVRGNKKLQGPAPLRSTIAHFMIRKMISESAMPGEIVWIDAFSGSGTLALEIASFHEFSKRSFAFQKFFNTPKFLKKEISFSNYMKQKKIFKSIHAVEKETDIFKVLAENSKGSRVHAHLSDFRDFCLPESSEQIYLIANPPYGVRLRSDFQISELFKKSHELGVTKIGLLHPDDFSKGSQAHWKLTDSFPISNGGLSVHLSVWERKSNSNSA
jgi:putative N6-adenine-specific DNA methylase